MSLIVTVQVAEAMARIAGVPDPRERLRLLRSAYREAKQPLLDEFHEYQKAGVRVVNGLEGTPQIIVSAPAKTWRMIFSRHLPAVEDPKVDFLPNDKVWSVDPVV